MKREDFTPRLLAVDLAGNERRSGFNFHANARNFPRDTINITDNFLNAKMPEFESFFPGEKSHLDLFLRVNRELRAQNVRELLEFGSQSVSRVLWNGEFVRPPGSTHGLFAQGRTYFYQGREIDRATHLGIDIAGLAQMPVRASNHGRIVFADYLGIYGNCIIIDHGLGLQSLYSHLSQMSVAVGDQVKTGQEIGRSGTSGMAGGDHLHFGMLIAGLEVSPLEWWDPSWLRNNITSKLELIPGGAGR
jgi:murein DD-endopeptidase MepM/ murein hydrolase activator NlpD